MDIEELPSATLRSCRTSNHVWRAALLGLLFPIAATLVHALGNGTAFSLLALLRLHSAEPLLWIIDSAPFVLALTACRISQIRQSAEAGFAAQRTRLEGERSHAVAEARAVLHHAPVGMLLVDNDMRIQAVNPAAEKLFGYSRSELLGQEIETLVPDEQRFAHRNLREHGTIALQRDLIGPRFRGRRKDGSVFPCQIGLRTITRGEERVTVASVMDSSEREEIERTLVEAKRRAEESAAAKSRFLANMSHEIRTPMNGVIGMTDLLLCTQLNAEQRSYAEVIQNSANALMGVLNDILDYSKIEVGKLRLEAIAFPLRDTIEQVARLFAPLAQNKLLDLRIDLSACPNAPVIGDPLRVRQLISNLLSNALKFTSEGYVAIRAKECAAGMMRIEVEDTGIGVSEDKRDEIFSAFAQADGSTTRTYGGTGLGLAICAQLVSMMGGTLGVDSEEGVGSTFWIELPLPLSTVERSDLETVRRPHGDGARILVAEDNLVNQKIVEGYLKRLGHEVVITENGKSALEALECGSFDLLLVDRYMPIMDGLELTAHVRKDPRLAALPVIALTASVMEQDRADCLGAGMNAVLSKPLSLDELGDALATALCRSDAMPSPARSDPSPTQGGTPMTSTPAPPLRPGALEHLQAELENTLIVLEMVDTFCSESAERISRLADLLAADERGDLAFHAHYMKSSARVLGAEGLSELCADIERCAKQGSSHQLAMLIAELEGEFERVQEALALATASQRDGAKMPAIDRAGA